LPCGRSSNLFSHISPEKRILREICRLNIPHDQVDALAPALLPNKSDEIVVYCANIQCRNSHIAARRLTLLGYSNVAVYPDGKQGWEDAGLPFDSVTDSTMAA